LIIAGDGNATNHSCVGFAAAEFFNGILEICTNGAWDRVDYELARPGSRPLPQPIVN
jgi:hypothetical protein